jgi:hypothetical protein
MDLAKTGDSTGVSNEYFLKKLGSRYRLKPIHDQFHLLVQTHINALNQYLKVSNINIGLGIGTKFVPMILQ